MGQKPPWRFDLALREAVLNRRHPTGPNQYRNQGIVSYDEDTD